MNDPVLSLYCGPAVNPHPIPLPRLSDADQLRKVVAEHRDSAASRRLDLLNDLIRPLPLVFRILLDRYGTVLDHPRDLTAEPVAGRRPFLRIHPSPSTTPTDRASAAARLADVRNLAYDLGRSLADQLRLDPEAAAARIEEILRGELRFLGPDAVRLLGPAAPGPIHSVAPEQHLVLTDVIDRVAAQARLRRGDPARRQPAVMLDVDLCALVPRRRTHQALRTAGARQGIARFATPETLDQMPTYHRPAWDRYCADTGLWQENPHADPDGVFDDFWHEFFNPWDRMRADEPAPGLRRFIWDVYDAGGCVVFNTGRRERVRDHTEAALARAGVVWPRMVMAPDDRQRPVHDHKAENLRLLDDLDIVAVFDDLCDNRRVLAKELPDALMVAVALPGFATEHTDTHDGAPVVASFERVPRTGRTAAARDRLALSDTRSLAELPIADLQDNAAAAEALAVRLDTAASTALVRTLIAHSDASAVKIAEQAVRLSPAADPVRRIHHILTRERFRKGPRTNYPLAVAERDLGPFVRAGAPIPVVTFGFPVKLHYNDLKTAGARPDLGELGALVRLRELQHSVRAVYPPGLQITVLTDGNHFRARPAALLDAYHGKLAEYHRLVGGADVLDIADVEQVAARRLGADVHTRRTTMIAAATDRLERGLSGVTVHQAPLQALAEATRRCAAVLGHRGDGTVMPAFTDLFRSLVYVTPIDVPAGTPRAAWSRLIYADVLHLTDTDVSPAVRQARRTVLAQTWQDTIGYLAVLEVDRDLGYDDTTLFPGRVRLTPNPRPGALGFTYLGGAGVLPWHGTAAVEARAQLSTDFAVALSDRGYVPVYSDLLGADQPWFMVPSVLARDGRLDGAITTGIHLRRR
ncbi:L-tyrosine/L-tryptophan isonitrile synthase family protein [Catellatospora tritici]|uniref:L-tyrosine/L-tryptophan isonitrile synthase family protein n=1 Tax=Catellatospora tritici TaxID=2851566 RepID=UPI001C2CC782|nr:L-tyrosine/L-tryptophan isonitrile synthase family protein [Catellatospora tritici]MBV1850608.1 isocyanide synthase family protein [Catellatospora tritici]